VSGMENASKRTIQRIELWHGILVLALLATLGQMGMIEPMALLMGGVFMGANFFLLSYGVAWLIAPLAGKGRLKIGIALLILKVVIFLALLTTVFFRFEIDAVSFSVGFSSLPVAILIETISTRAHVRI
jgi:hypothetical protein